MRLVRRDPLRLELLRGLLDRLLLLLLLLGLELVELLLVVVGLALPKSTAIRSGPLVPGPKPLSMRSYAWRTVVDLGICPLFCWPSCRLSTGMASTRRIATAISIAGIGWLPMKRAQRAQPWGR